MSEYKDDDIAEKEVNDSKKSNLAFKTALTDTLDVPDEVKLALISLFASFNEDEEPGSTNKIGIINELASMHEHIEHLNPGFTKVLINFHFFDNLASFILNQYEGQEAALLEILASFSLLDSKTVFEMVKKGKFDKEKRCKEKENENINKLDK